MAGEPVSLGRKFLPWLLALTPCIAAAQLGAQDTGTYELLDQQMKPTDFYYRLSLKGGKWFMEGRKPGGDWQNITCDAGCEYRNTSAAEVASYFPADWTSRLALTCIQNIAQAFCRGIERGNPARKLYAVVALVTEKPVVVFLRPGKVP